ncbi:hypothetical protein [Rhizobium sp. BR 249]|uniref:hypothetical protein n=1 Tax=Rhizobium sp. BR 249 TaxID=3040011 RepID=UPI0039BFFE43
MVAGPGGRATVTPVSYQQNIAIACHVGLDQELWNDLSAWGGRKIAMAALRRSVSKRFEMDTDIWDRAFYDDGEWVSWSDVDEQLRYQEWRAKYPNAGTSLVPHFEELLSLTESYHLKTGRHLNV